MINIITNSELIHNILTKYLTNVEYDRLNPASILIESPILILSSLTITSMFIFAFLIIAIRRQSNKLKEPKNKNQGKISNKKPKNSNIKLLSNNTRKSVLIQNEDLESKNNTNEIINLNLSNSVTYQKIKSEMKKKMKNEEELVPNSELRKLNTNNNEFTKRQTLSLSGPIALYDLHFEKNTFELKNPQDVKDFFGDKEVSSVERISSFKSTSGLGFNFENNNEKEKNDLE